MPVYLIHLDEPIGHARHYIGYADDVDKRLVRHRRGNGGRLLKVAARRGIKFHVARIWPDGDRALERRLKRLKNGPRLCPICREGR